MIKINNNRSTMDSPMLKMLKTQNPNTVYPTNMGQIWTTEEENILLQELNNNINIETIAQSHNRTVGGIKGRQQSIAYKMYCNKICINEIATKTKLSKEQIMEIVVKKENKQKQIKPEIKQQSEQNLLVSDNELKEIYIELKDLKLELKDLKFEIKEIKNTVQELVDMMKAVYEFEDKH